MSCLWQRHSLTELNFTSMDTPFLKKFNTKSDVTDAKIIMSSFGRIRFFYGIN